MNSSSSEPQTESPPTEETLPEWEPLTPELLEDEAKRGDFVLRWAVVLLAVLLGCTDIATTETLVHIKTGQYIAGHGWLPPANDVFSYTADDRPWTNSAWLFDLLCAGVFAVSGATGLSLLKALLAAVTFGLVVHLNRPGASSWWGSVMAAVALLVAYPQLTAQPELITLLGLAVTLWCLIHWREDGSQANLWALPALFLLWGNLDPRVSLGLVVLLLYGLGEWLGRWLGRPGFAGTNQRRRFGMATGACFLAVLGNPFGWHALAEGYRLDAVAYPSMREHYLTNPSTRELEYFSLLSPTFWANLTLFGIAGLVVLAAAAVIFVLNRRRVDFGDIAVVVGLSAWAVVCRHELAAASLAAAVLGTWNAGQWYQANFRQTYSVETAELIFSRGGRAVTVLAFFSLAFLRISGRLSGAADRRVGFGWSETLADRISSLRGQLQDSYDDRPFHFVLSQGDLLIWLDQKVFVDHRVALYAGAGEQDLLARHDRTRRALRRKRGEPAQVDRWKRTFNRYNVTHALPRLSGPRPDYRTYFDLLNSRHWQLGSLGAATAVFYRTDISDRQGEAYANYLANHRFDFLENAFRTGDEQPPQRLQWARPPSFYETYFIQPRRRIPNAIQRARHYVRHLQPQLSPQFGSAAAHLAIREANTGLAAHPQSAVGYRVLGKAYQYLENLESRLAGGSNVLSHRRFFQSVQAYNQSLVIDADNLAAHRNLALLYLGHQKFDLALREVQRVRELTTHQTATGRQIEQQRRWSQIEDRLESRLEGSSGQSANQAGKAKGQKPKQQNTQPLRAAQSAYRNGRVLDALQTLEKNEEAGSGNLQRRLFQAILQMEAGQSERAFEILGRLEGVAQQYPLPQWPSYAAIAGLANGDYQRAVDIWNKAVQKTRKQQLQSLMQTLPFVQPPPLFLGQEGTLWPWHHTAAAQAALYRFPARMSTAELHTAACYLETGQRDQAAEAFHRILEIDPETSGRPLIRFYLHQLTGELIDRHPPSDRIPVSPEMFAEETGEAESP